MPRNIDQKSTNKYTVHMNSIFLVMYENKNIKNKENT